MGFDHIAAEVSLKFLGGGGAACSHSVFFDPDGSRKRQHRAACEWIVEILRHSDRCEWVGEILGIRALSERTEEIVRTRVLKLSTIEERIWKCLVFCKTP
ncbi:hypothetical protein NE237_014061 [Protea cynaroides]|uniref:Uncharacterized protein n=1 Tax=Protea cynaroides TaxID=273540 RepID=A0A9Q0H2V9_9MAGN|nr:hypothetical protein NE237_014061 [Protea cynaroides]